MISKFNGRGRVVVYSTEHRCLISSAVLHTMSSRLEMLLLLPFISFVQVVSNFVQTIWDDFIFSVNPIDSMSLMFVSYLSHISFSSMFLFGS